MKTYLINMHLLVPRSRSSAKAKVKYKVTFLKKRPFRGHSCFTNTSCFLRLHFQIICDNMHFRYTFALSLKASSFFFLIRFHFQIICDNMHFRYTFALSMKASSFFLIRLHFQIIRYNMHFRYTFAFSMKASSLVFFFNKTSYINDITKSNRVVHS